MEADREDAARLCRGDTSGLAGLMSRHQDRLFRYLLRLLGDRNVAEDVFQQTWLHVAERIKRYDASRPFAPGSSRSPATWRSTSCAGGSPRASTRRRSRWPRPPPRDPLERAIARQRASRVAAAVDALGPLDREVLTLRFEDELELGELAATLGVPLPTAKARLYRALERLRGRLAALRAPGGAR